MSTDIPSIIPDTHDDSSNEEITLRSLVATHASLTEFRERLSIKESRSVLIIQPEHLAYNLTNTTLLGPHMIATQPFVFLDDCTGSLLAFYHLGRKLAGHAGIVHGGLIAVLLDECMGRASFPRLPGKIAVTAKLELEYQNPLYVDTVILIRANTIKAQGRKAWVEATVEDARDGRLLTKGSGLFVEPKWAAEMAQMM